ncbi:MAG: hypothetical protein ACFB4I_02200 [Cyanophyceae cyanobacterium]
MNPNPKLLQVNSSGLSCLLTVFLIAFLLGSVGLGWLANGLLVVVAAVLLLPAVGWIVFRWWLQRNLVESQCPVCRYEFTGFNGTQCQCPNCKEPLKVESRQFVRLTPPGTIDVEAVDVSAQSRED